MSDAESARSETGSGRTVLDLGDDYFFSVHGRVEFIVFEYRVASLAWLRDRTVHSVDAELAELRATRTSAAHRIPGWEGESDQVLDESLAVLDEETRQIGAGIIVLLAAAALESLMNHMLDQPSDTRLHRAGLARKADELAARWQTAIDVTEFREDVGWLRKRRNVFAHRLIDDEPGPTPAEVFDDDMAHEALVRMSAIAWMLEEGWEEYLTRQN
ncbi:hypothetical protein OG981_53445 [Streptomyces mirabilis]|uniref:hypothetical protein n=1 Tax=Streptomyces mirabilis TaxID=68239 RepID=UPI002E1B7ADE